MSNSSKGAEQPYIIFENSSKNPFYIHMTNPGCTFDGGGGSTKKDARWNTTNRPDKGNYTATRQRPCTFFDNDLEYRVVSSREDLKQEDSGKYKFKKVTSNRIPINTEGLAPGETLQLKLPMEDVLTVERTPTRCGTLFHIDDIVTTDDQGNTTTVKGDIPYNVDPNSATEVYVKSDSSISKTPDVNGKNKWYQVKWSQDNPPDANITGSNVVSDNYYLNDLKDNGDTQLVEIIAKSSRKTYSFDAKTTLTGEEDFNKHCVWDTKAKRWHHDTYWEYTWLNSNYTKVQPMDNKKNVVKTKSRLQTPMEAYPVVGFNKDREKRPVFCWDEYNPDWANPKQDVWGHETQMRNVLSTCDPRLNGAGNNFSIVPVGNRYTLTPNYFRTPDGKKMTKTDVENMYKLFKVDLPDIEEDATIIDDNVNKPGKYAYYNLPANPDSLTHFELNFDMTGRMGLGGVWFDVSHVDGTNTVVESYYVNQKGLEDMSTWKSDHEMLDSDVSGNKYNGKNGTIDGYMNQSHYLQDISGSCPMCDPSNEFRGVAGDQYNSDVVGSKTSGNKNVGGCQLTDTTSDSLTCASPKTWMLNRKKIYYENARAFKEKNQNLYIYTLVDSNQVKSRLISVQKPKSFEKLTIENTDPFGYPLSGSDISVVIPDGKYKVISFENSNSIITIETTGSGKKNYKINNPLTASHWNTEEAHAFAADIGDNPTGHENRTWWVKDRRAKNWCNWIQNYTQNLDSYCWAANEKVYRIDPTTGKRLQKNGVTQMTETKALKFSNDISTNLNINVHEVLGSSNKTIKGCSTYVKDSFEKMIGEQPDGTGCGLWNSNKDYACAPLDWCNQKESDSQYLKCNFQCNSDENTYCGDGYELCKWDVENVIPKCSEKYTPSNAKVQKTTNGYMCYNGTNNFSKLPETRECGAGTTICKNDLDIDPTPDRPSSGSIPKTLNINMTVTLNGLATYSIVGLESHINFVTKIQFEVFKDNNDSTSIFTGSSQVIKKGEENLLSLNIPENVIPNGGSSKDGKIFIQYREYLFINFEHHTIEGLVFALQEKVKLDKDWKTEPISGEKPDTGFVAYKTYPKLIHISYKAAPEPGGSIPKCKEIKGNSTGWKTLGIDNDKQPYACYDRSGNSWTTGPDLVSAKCGNDAQKCEWDFDESDFDKCSLLENKPNNGRVPDGGCPGPYACVPQGQGNDNVPWGCGNKKGTGCGPNSYTCVMGTDILPSGGSSTGGTIPKCKEIKGNSTGWKSRGVKNEGDTYICYDKSTKKWDGATSVGSEGACLNGEKCEWDFEESDFDKCEEIQGRPADRQGSTPYVCYPTDMGDRKDPTKWGWGGGVNTPCADYQQLCIWND